MRLLRRWFQNKKAMPQPQHAVIVHFRYGSTNLAALFALERELEAAIASMAVGEFDGNEVNVDGSDGFLYMYGPDGDQLFEVIHPVLKSSPFMNGARVTVRYGEPSESVSEREIVIGA